MRSVQYRRWCPPQSPLRIEFPADLLVELHPPSGSLENSGILYGQRHGREVRVLTTRPEPGEVLDPVGVFVSRGRGEVFLTESNLDFFEREGAAFALVVAASHAGFFVREPDESIQAVRSHEEFPVATQPTSLEQLTPPKPVARTSKWAWSAAAVTMMLSLPVAALAYLRPVFPQPPLQPLALHVEEDRGPYVSQLRIAWTPGRHAILQIADGGERIAVTVPPEQSEAIYARRSSEVKIGLIPLDGDPARSESALFVGPSLPVLPTEQLSSEIAHSRAEADGLRAEAVANGARIATLQEAIAKLTSKRR